MLSKSSHVRSSSGALAWVDGLQRWRWVLVGLWLACVGISAAAYLVQFRIDNSVGAWFREDDPERRLLQRFNTDFGAREWTFVLLETESIYDPGFLAELAAAGRRIEALDHVERVLSISNVRDSVVDADGFLDYQPLYPLDAGTLSAAQLREFRAKLADNPIFADNLYRPGDERHTVLLVQNDNLLHEQAPYRIELLDAIGRILDDYASVEQHAVAGTTVLNAELNRAAKRDMLVYYVLISLMLVIGGRLFLPRSRDLAVLLPVVAGTVLPVLGLVGLLGKPFNMVTIMLPTILVSIGVSVVVHLINDYHHERRRLTDREALAQTLASLARPALWTSVTTIFGFLALATSDVIPIRQLGWLGALGIGLSVLWTFTLAPVLLIWLGDDRPAAADKSRTKTRVLVHAALRLVERHPRRVLAAGALVLVGLGGLKWLEADTDYVRFFRDGNPVRADYQRIKSSGFPQYYLSVVLDYPNDSGYTEPRAFAATVDLERAITGLPGVRKVLSAAQLLREADRALTGKREDWQQLREFDAQRVGQLLLLTEASGNRDLTDLITGDRLRSQFVVMTDYLSSKALERLREDIVALGHTQLPRDLGLSVVGTSVLWANMDAEVVQTQLTSLSVICGILLLTLPLVLRSWRFGLLGLVVSFLPIACTLGFMAWFDVKVNIATCLIGAIAVGVAVDDTIYFLSRVKLELARGRSLRWAVRRAMLVTGTAMLTTSLMLMAGFLTMAASDFLPSASFGILFAVTVALALIGDLFILPVLLRIREVMRRDFPAPTSLAAAEPQEN